MICISIAAKLDKAKCCRMLSLLALLLVATPALSLDCYQCDGIKETPCKYCVPHIVTFFNIAKISSVCFPYFVLLQRV